MLSSRSGPSIAMSGGRLGAENLLHIERRAGVPTSLLRKGAERVEEDHALPGFHRFGVSGQSGLNHTGEEVGSHIPVVVGQDPLEGSQRRLQPAVVQQSVTQCNYGL